MSTLHDAARRVVAAWAGLRPTRPSWIEDVNAAVLALDAALKAEPAQEPITRIFGTLPVHDAQHPEPAQQAEPAQEPVARECSDPMCACRGGPCAECEAGEREKEIEDLRSSLYFYQRRCEALQLWQSKMRDPERTIVCDILANGKTLDSAFAGDRYTAPPQRKPLTEEEIAEVYLEWDAAPRRGMTDFARAIERKVRGETE